MKIDIVLVLILIIFLLGFWRYFRHPTIYRCLTPYRNRRRQGLFLMAVAVLLGVVYYYSNIRTVKASMNGAELEHCQRELQLCATRYSDKITQANQLWEEHQRLRSQYDQLSRQYQEAVGTNAIVHENEIDDLSTMLQSRLFH